MKITTAGESHGKGLFAIIEGMPAGLEIDIARINEELFRRQSGYGRGARQSIERDEVEILSGVINRKTTGSPVTLAVWNRDYENWKEYIAPEGCGAEKPLTRLRPGHADFAGAKKFDTADARAISERASARETAIRVAVGAVCRLFLEQLGVLITGYVRSVGEVQDGGEYAFEEIVKSRSDLLGMMSKDVEKEAQALIDGAKDAGDTLGGVLELRVKGLKSGFGSCMTYAEKLDARLSAAVMSVQAIKGVEIGAGFESAKMLGSNAHDEIYLQDGELTRRSNRAGGIEGGMSNGGELVLRAAMKPLPTLKRGLSTVDLKTGEAALSAAERSDVCAVTACEQVLESVVCAELVQVILERLGGDTMSEVSERYGRLKR